MGRAGHHGGSRPSFTLTELLVVVAILGLLAGLLIPGIRLAQESANQAKNLARMKTVATALLAGAAENQGRILSSSSTRGRWPTANHQYFGIRTDLNWENSAPAAEINQSSYIAEVMRPAHLEKMRKSMVAGTTTLSPVGIWLVNGWLTARGANAQSGIPAKPLISVLAPSKTPLVAMPSEDNGLWTTAAGIHPSAASQGFTGRTDNTGPAPIRNRKMLYVMCDGSAQTRDDFWPFRESEPWRSFHPQGSQADPSEAP
jgi:prepilin-type N-terminal cleavage/methylation domain-containing protein